MAKSPMRKRQALAMIAALVVSREVARGDVERVAAGVPILHDHPANDPRAQAGDDPGHQDDQDNFEGSQHELDEGVGERWGDPGLAQKVVEPAPVAPDGPDERICPAHSGRGERLGESSHGRYSVLRCVLPSA